MWTTHEVAGGGLEPSQRMQVVECLTRRLFQLRLSRVVDYTISFTCLSTHLPHFCFAMPKNWTPEEHAKLLVALIKTGKPKVDTAQIAACLNNGKRMPPLLNDPCLSMSMLTRHQLLQAGQHARSTLRFAGSNRLRKVEEVLSRSGPMTLESHPSIQLR